MDGPTIPQSNERYNRQSDNHMHDDPFGPAIRSVFFGNVRPDCETEDIMGIFRRPILPGYDPISVQRIDLKKGFCFVFFNDAKSPDEKERTERYVMELNGKRIQRVSDELRAEFARGDGRVRRKEDDRRRNIVPCDTLFVVNFQEATTQRKDLEMLFAPYGEIVRIDMKKNYAFVQFTDVPSATRAKEATNQGKLDQSVLTVEYVAPQDNRSDRGRMDRGDRDRDDRRRDDSFTGRREPDRDSPRGGVGGRGDGADSGRGGGGYRNSRDDEYRRRDDTRGRDRDDEYRRRDDFRDRDDEYRRRDDFRERDRDDRRGDNSRLDDRRGPARSRSRSPPYRYRSRSPPSYRYRSRSPSPAGRGGGDRGDFRGGNSSGGRGDDYKNRDRDRDSGARPRSGGDRDYRSNGDGRAYK